jgi:hypothetical protein
VEVRQPHPQPETTPVGVWRRVERRECRTHTGRWTERIQVAAEIGHLFWRDPQRRKFGVVDGAMRYLVERAHAASSAYNSTGMPHTTR